MKPFTARASSRLREEFGNNVRKKKRNKKREGNHWREGGTQLLGYSNVAGKLSESSGVPKSGGRRDWRGRPRGPPKMGTK